MKLVVDTVRKSGEVRFVLKLADATKAFKDAEKKINGTILVVVNESVWDACTEETQLAISRCVGLAVVDMAEKSGIKIGKVNEV